MTLPEVEEQFEYWGENPPTHELLKAYLGAKGMKWERPKTPEQHQAEGAMNPRELAGWIKATGGNRARRG
jgi:hypothetical protein